MIVGRQVWIYSRESVSILCRLLSTVYKLGTKCGTRLPVVYPSSSVWKRPSSFFFEFYGSRFHGQLKTDGTFLPQNWSWN